MVDEGVYPELLVPNLAYEINKSARVNVLKKRGKWKKMYIVFYGGVKSGINRDDVKSLRYICGDFHYVYGKLCEMEFKTWMDYRAYYFIPNKDYTYGVIGGRFEFEPETLYRMATYMRSRKRATEARKRIKEARARYNDEDRVRARMELRKSVDKRVKRSLAELMRVEGLKKIG